MANLYIVGTPIGNLEDLSFRALRILKEVDLILCEDTRVTKKLLDHYGVKTPLLSYHQHSKLNKTEEIIRFLKNDKNLALVSDAGTPGISDPGNKLIYDISKELGEKARIIPVPGSSAITAAASISGFAMDKFSFLGFPPAKKKRSKFFERLTHQLIRLNFPVVIYESPHRIIKTLKEIKKETQSKGLKINLTVCRELTKKFETVYRGEISPILNQLEKEKIKGEFVIVIESVKNP